MSNLKQRFWAIVVVELVFLIAVATYYNGIMIKGYPITLKSVQVDPDDIFRGSYLALNYGIEQYKPKPGKYDHEFKLIDDFSRNETVNVFLKKKEKYWIIRDVDHDYSEQEVSANNIFLKAKVKNVIEDQLILDYGLNRFYVSRKKAQKYGFGGGSFDVRVKVRYDGKGVIEAVYYKGKKI